MSRRKPVKNLSLKFSYNLIINHYEKWEDYIYKKLKINSDRKQK